jgi:hypothetical protein
MEKILVAVALIIASAAPASVVWFVTRVTLRASATKSGARILVFQPTRYLTDAAGPLPSKRQLVKESIFHGCASNLKKQQP